MPHENAIIEEVGCHPRVRHGHAQQAGSRGVTGGPRQKQPEDSQAVTDGRVVNSWLGCGLFATRDQIKCRMGCEWSARLKALVGRTDGGSQPAFMDGETSHNCKFATPEKPPIFPLLLSTEIPLLKSTRHMATKKLRRGSECDKIPRVFSPHRV